MGLPNNAMEITLRRAAKRDLPEIRRMLFELGAYHAALKPELCRATPQLQEPKALRKRMLKPKNRRVYLAVDGQGHACGLLHLFWETRRNPVLLDCKYVMIEDIYVEERLRGQGIGRLLMRKAREEARACGAESIELNVWACNEAALGFYEKEGFTPWLRRMQFSVTQ